MMKLLMHDALRGANKYVQDVMTAGECFQKYEVTDARFVIDPTKQGAARPA